MSNNNTSWFKLPSFLQRQSKSATTTMQAAAPKNMSNEKAIPSALVSWIPKIPSKKSNASLLNEATFTIDTTKIKSPPPPHPLETTADLAEQHTGSIDNCIHNKDIVPLRQFLRYSMNRSDQRNFQRRRLMHPSSPKYEIEWQKNQWLQLDDSTNKHIEHLCKNGFTKMAIRKDTSLKKHISYSNPSDMDVLLELSFDICDKSTTASQDDEQQHEPIVCHQPRKFSVRRTLWWRTTYHVAVAYLPDWVDPDLCCEAVMMDAPSVLVAMTDNYSRSSLSSSVHHQSKMPDTPIVSQKSSFLHLQQHQLQHEDQWSYKPLQFSNPPFLMDKPALVIG
ncbi:hypothetical protein MAM1_0194d07724 [Mucor ambiguus]|uniref:Uncharacterized protein n=1 Tax=Mucor ambiguus TaxID=91626 RepID=A0A0C9MXC9_9FUNG|nr:hypothetical protein MAM1_0194d07724 [Mucor ambiguus]